MRVNANFEERAVVHGAAEPWVASPAPGVHRRMLDRIGEEVARATTIVKFAPESAFDAHTHGGGEEFVVLEGVFSDEYGDFPAGSYVRNPPTSRHTPSSAPGCTILVKLCQFHADDRTHVRMATDKMRPVDAAGRPGVSIVPLYADEREEVRIEHWKGGADIAIDAPGGLEAFVLKGRFTEAGEEFGRHSWLRLPQGARLEAKAGDFGAQVWIKSGHLLHLDDEAR